MIGQVHWFVPFVVVLGGMALLIAGHFLSREEHHRHS
jgi:hypothetical protein